MIRCNQPTFIRLCTEAGDGWFHIGCATHFVVSGWQEMSKGGQKLQSERSTHLVDQQICWYGWCWLAVPFVVSVPFDDKICWYVYAFRINILYNWPILLMDEQLMLGLQNQHSVQLTHFVDVDVLLLCNGCSAIYAVQLALCNVACIHLQGASWAILLQWLFVCTCIAWVWSNCCVPGMSENLKSGLVHRNLKSSFQPFSFWYGRCKITFFKA